MNDQPMNDKPRRNLATIARKVLSQVRVYEYIKTDIKSGLTTCNYAMYITLRALTKEISWCSTLVLPL